jgi:hypothetical protein
MEGPGVVAGSRRPTATGFVIQEATELVEYHDCDTARRGVGPCAAGTLHCMEHVEGAMSPAFDNQGMTDQRLQETIQSDVEQWRVVWHAASQVPSAGVLVEKMDMSIR